MALAEGLIQVQREGSRLERIVSVMMPLTEMQTPGRTAY